MAIIILEQELIKKKKRFLSTHIAMHMSELDGQGDLHS